MNLEPTPETAEAAVEPTSLWSKMFNILAAPGEVFDEIRRLPAANANWLVPAVLSCVVGLVFTTVMLAQPDLIAEITKAQEAAMDKQVAAGAMTEAQAEKTVETIRGVTKIMMPVMAVVGTFVYIAMIALLLWLLMAKIFKAGVSVMKAFEITGLSSVIGILGGLVTLCIVLIKGTMVAAPNAALFLETFDPTNPVHQVLGALNVFTLWFMAVLAVGVSRQTGRSFGASAGWIFGSWLVVRGLSIVGSVFLSRMQA